MLNKSDGIDVKLVHDSNVLSNICDRPPVNPVNRPDGIDVMDVFLNVVVNPGISPALVPRCGNSVASEPSIAAIFAALASVLLKKIAAVPELVLYGAVVPASPPKPTV